MKSHDNNGSLRLLGNPGHDKNTSNSSGVDASVLAKLAEDVIAWNRPLTPNEAIEGARPAQVAKLESLSRGFKIRRIEDETANESTEGVVRLFHKEK